MKIEFGFQANCSELVAYLGATTKEEIVELMLRMSEITGYTWRISNSARKEEPNGDVSMHSFSILLPNDRIRDLLEVNIDPDHGSNSLGILPSSIVPLWSDLIPEFVKEHLNEVTNLILDEDYKYLTRFALNNYLYLTDIPVEQPILIENKKSPSNTYLDFKNFDCDGGNELNFQIDSIFIEDFPFFHWFRKQLDAPYDSHDGGTYRYYRGWMAYHFFLEEKTDGMTEIESLPLYKELIADEFEDSIIERLKSNPPLPDSGKLTEKEIEEILFYHNLLSRRRGKKRKGKGIFHWLKGGKKTERES